MAEITLSLEVYEGLKAEVRAARERIAILEGELRQSHEHGAEVEIATLRAALLPLDFAVANLDPSGVVRGWAAPVSELEKRTPADGLEIVGRVLRVAPWATPEEHAQGAQYVQFAEEARQAALQKPSRRGQPPGPRASAEEYGPQTEEAKAVHDAFLARLGQPGDDGT